MGLIFSIEFKFLCRQSSAPIPSVLLCITFLLQTFHLSRDKSNAVVIKYHPGNLKEVAAIPVKQSKPEFTYSEVMCPLARECNRKRTAERSEWKFQWKQVLPGIEAPKGSTGRAVIDIGNILLSFGSGWISLLQISGTHLQNRVSTSLQNCKSCR